MRPLPLLVSLLLPLAACAPDANLTLTPRQQPVVSRTDYVLDLAKGPRGLAAGELTRLAAWLDGLKLAYGDSLSIDDPTGSPGVRQEVAAIAGDRGKQREPAAPVTAGSGAPGMARIVLSRSTARIEGCPDWHHEDLPRESASTSRNYGCAVNGALAAMIADPQDLVRGRAAGGPGDPRATVKAITVYRDRPASGAGALKAERAGGK